LNRPIQQVGKRYCPDVNIGVQKVKNIKYFVSKLLINFALKMGHWQLTRSSSSVACKDISFKNSVFVVRHDKNIKMFVFND